MPRNESHTNDQSASRAQRRDPGEDQMDWDTAGLITPSYADQAAADVARYSEPTSAGGGGGIPLPGGGANHALAGLPTNIGQTSITPEQLGVQGGAKSTSLLSKLFGGSGVKGMFDPTSLVLGGLSLLGKDQPLFQPRQSFAGTAVDPTKTLTGTLDAIKALSADIAANNTPKLKNAVVPEGPAPVSIPGIPFQIGGGLGRDPAIGDPSILEGSPVANPFAQSSSGLPAQQAKRRTS